MSTFDLLLFAVYPYLVIAIFFGGHGYRYMTDLYHWNAASSELLDKKTFWYGITLFHWGIIFTFLGHFFGLLTPQSLLDRVGISAAFHETVSIYTGMLFGTLALTGLVLLLGRRVGVRRIAVTTSASDIVVVVFLLVVVALGTYNTYFKRFDVVGVIAPWIQSIVTLRPRPELMVPVPFSYKVHILLALALLAYSPFTRLVHIWSVPVQYLVRKYVVYRTRERVLAGSFGSASEIE